VLLEVNTQPGMTRTSLRAGAGGALRHPLPDLCAWMVEQARHGA
jgi:D-alanine-D-alanine ligase